MKMTREQAYEILNPLQNKIAFSGTPVDIVTFSAFMDEGAELKEYVESKQAQYA
jgi:hypothetical protein